MRPLSFARSTAGAVLVALAVCAGTAHAQGTFAISLANCGTPNHLFEFTINGSGADPAQGLEVDITTSEPGAFAEPFFVVPVGTPTDVGLPVPLNPDGTFSFVFSAGTGQLLPATVAVYDYDLMLDARAATPLLTMTVDRSSSCTSGSLADASTGVGNGNGLPATRVQCKNGGTSYYGVFVNQGDCVSYVTTQGTNPPALLP